MRTTLTLETDVAQRTRQLAARLGKPFKVIVNEALRLGLEQVERPMTRQPYRTEPREMGLNAGLSLDNIQELLAQVEGENFR